MYAPYEYVVRGLTVREWTEQQVEFQRLFSRFIVRADRGQLHLTADLHAARHARARSGLRRRERLLLCMRQDALAFSVPVRAKAVPSPLEGSSVVCCSTVCTGHAVNATLMHAQAHLPVPECRNC